MYGLNNFYLEKEMIGGVRKVGGKENDEGKRVKTLSTCMLEHKVFVFKFLSIYRLSAGTVTFGEVTSLLKEYTIKYMYEITFLYKEYEGDVCMGEQRNTQLKNTKIRIPQLRSSILNVFMYGITPLCK